MLYILLVLGIVTVIWGAFRDDEGTIVLGFIIGFPTLVAMLIAGGIYNYDSATIDSRLAVLEEQNTTVLTQVEPLVQQALNYESSAYQDLKLDVNSTSAKSIKYIYNGSYTDIPAAGYLKANQIYKFT